MDQENHPVKGEHDGDIENLLEKPLINEESDIPDYIDLNAFSGKRSSNQNIEKTFRCTQCTNRYRKLEYLTIHAAVHGDDLNCSLCGQQFLDRKELRYHISSHIRHKMLDDKKIIYSCPFCLKISNTRKQHVVHIRVHTNERPHKCEICGEGFKQLGALKDHHVTHTKERKYVCDVCQGAYTTSSSLKRHKRRIHERGRTLNCILCNAQFLNRADFNSHRINIHPHAAFKKTCPLCSMMFYNKLAYSVHKQLHLDHLPRKKQLFMSYVCSICGEETNSLKLFMEHKRWHLSYTEEELKEAARSKSFACKFCSTMYKNKQWLFQHLGIHVDKLVTCDLCHNSFSYLELWSHKRRAHQVLNCRICFKVIIGRAKMYYHYKKHLAMNLRNNYRCKICGKKYMVKTMLKYHYKLKHEKTAVKNFKCSLCRKCFMTQQAMLQHKKEVHSVRVNLKCSKCDSILKTPKEVNKHRLKHIKADSSTKKAGTSCEVCKKTFRYSKNYDFHVSLGGCVNLFMEQTQLRVCGICGKHFKKELYLKKHIKFKHERKSKIKTLQKSVSRPEKKVYQCDICGEKFDFQSDYDLHSSLHIKTEEEDRCAKDVDYKNVKCEMKTESQ